jgi:hypothetical protein
MEKVYLILNLVHNRYVAGCDHARNLEMNHDARRAKKFLSKNEAEMFLETCNGYGDYYTIIEALSTK